MRPTLTPRQKHFLDKLCELHERLRRPVHYALLAKEIGVSRFSAYDMLKLLERKGVAGRAYVRGEQRTGPGRSMVVFYPKEVDAALAAARVRGSDTGDDWEQLRQTILHRLRGGRAGHGKQVVDDKKSGPSGESPLAYCAEMIGALLLGLQEGLERTMRARLIQTLRALPEAGELGLGTLAGLGLGKSLRLSNDVTSVDAVLSRVQMFQRNLSGLDEQNKKALVDLLRDAVIALDSE